jgi:hypothetical protein
MSLFTAIVVAELPPLKPLSAYPAPAPSGHAGSRASLGGGSMGPHIPAAAKPKFVLTLPAEYAERAPKDVLSFCFPDLDHLLRAPYAYEHTADEYVFTLTQKDNPQRVHGFCRRYRIGSPGVAHRLDLPPHTSADEEAASHAPTYQCICILSEK